MLKLSVTCVGSVRNILFHFQAGLVTLGGKSVSLLEYKNDWQKMEQLMVAASPDFPPGNIQSVLEF